MKDVKGYDKYIELRDAVLDDPQRVVSGGEAAIRSSAVSLRPRLLAVVGSGFRRILKLEEAGACFGAAETLATRFDDDWAVADTKQRKAHAYFDFGWPDRSLELAKEATLIFNTLRDKIGLGRATFDQGLWLVHLGNYHEARKAYSASLEILPISETESRSAALMNLADIAEREGDQESVEHWALRARSLPGASLVNRGAANDFLGRVAARRGDLEQSAIHFRTALELYKRGGFLFEQAVVSVVLCRVLVDLGELSEARGRIEDAQKIVRGVKNPHVSAIVLELAAIRARGEELSAKLLAEMHQRLWKTITRVDRPARKPLPRSLRSRPTD